MTSHISLIESLLMADAIRVQGDIPRYYTLNQYDDNQYLILRYFDMDYHFSKIEVESSKIISAYQPMFRIESSTVSLDIEVF